MSRSVVYFMMPKDGGPIRIGCTSNPAETRMANLQVTSPVPLTVLATVPGNRIQERMLHYKFSADCLHGSWFRPSSRLWRVIGEAEQNGAITGVPNHDVEPTNCSDLFEALRPFGVTRRNAADVLGLKSAPCDWVSRCYPSDLAALFQSLSSGWMTVDEFVSLGPKLLRAA